MDDSRVSSRDKVEKRLQLFGHRRGPFDNRGEEGRRARAGPRGERRDWSVVSRLSRSSW